MKIVINGMGRIGRAALKLILETPELELVAVNNKGTRVIIRKFKKTNLKS
jgi:glyceraldehyde-3-phosphate dehydrogenase/erythrose-4-phosphate dehydrogenase